MRLSKRLLLLAPALGLLLVRSAFALDIPEARLRLFLAGHEAAGGYDVGLEMVVPETWHTYWRTPGDAGMPPQFDFSRSTNLAAATVAFPAPTRLELGGLTSLIYEGAVVLPVHVVPKDAGKPVELKLNLAYGLCRNICVPAAGGAAVMLRPADQPRAGDSALFSTAEHQVPRPERAGDAVTISGLTLAPEKASDGTDEPAAWIEVTAPAGAAVDLFAEGPDAWALPQPQLVDGTATVHRFALSLAGVPKDTVLAGHTLRLTATSPAGNVQASRPFP